MHFRNGIVAATAALAFSAMVSADVIDPGYHPIDRCVKIANVDQFPDVAIVGAYRGPGGGTITRYVVKADSCLDKGYKFNSFYLFWVEKTYLETQGSENLPLGDYLISVSAKKRTSTLLPVAPMGLIAVDINPYGGVVPDSNPVVKEEIAYNIIADPAGEGVTVYLAEKVSTDEDGAVTRENFDPIVGIAAVSAPTRGVPLNLNARLGHGYLLFSPEFSGAVSADLIDCRGRTVLHFGRQCRAGNTYMVSAANISAGIYWLRVQSAGATVNVPMSTFR